ncbi:hypothetical protein ACP70R_011635 [Stipagrostis hirtigluma subsp. patula]
MNGAGARGCPAVWRRPARPRELQQPRSRRGWEAVLVPRRGKTGAAGRREVLESGNAGVLLRHAAAGDEAAARVLLYLTLDGVDTRVGLVADGAVDALSAAVSGGGAAAALAATALTNFATVDVNKCTIDRGAPVGHPGARRPPPLRRREGAPRGGHSALRALQAAGEPPPRGVRRRGARARRLRRRWLRPRRRLLRLGDAAASRGGGSRWRRVEGMSTHGFDGTPLGHHDQTDAEERHPQTAPETMTTKRASAADDDDRLSALQDALLHSVMSFLTARQAVQTCTLSRRWRDLWRSSLCLDIGCGLKIQRREQWEKLEEFAANQWRTQDLNLG